jgi:aspartyl-tRNA(Asn)/glutamyl-tRNA(Gln) amidotransferase subunit B
MSKLNYEPVIGLEVHVQLKTESKVFCGCSTKFGAPQNTNVCPVCLGLPGSLPVLNKKTVEFAVLAGLSLNCKVSNYCKFDRKNYYYPDLPKNYQISQYDKPFAENGWIETVSRKIKIKRVHLEEDAGKLIHSENEKASFVDFNRTGMPLLEIVSEPDIFSPDEAQDYLTVLKQIIQYLGISDCNMEEGSLRCDANISLRPKGTTGLGVKTEIKNMNSFKGVHKALCHEIERQTRALEEGKRIVQETRLWDPDTLTTHSMRSKEEAHDYRYFPEPDLVPVELSDEWISGIKKQLPEIPKERAKRFVLQYGIPEYDAGVLTNERVLADYYESAVKCGGNPKLISNWTMSELLRELNNAVIPADKSPVSSKNLSSLVQLIEGGTISGKIGKDVFAEMFKTGKSPEEIIKEKGLIQINDTGALDAAIEKVIENNQKSVADYKSGKENAVMFLVGQVMKETKGKANPGVVQKMLKEKLL